MGCGSAKVLQNGTESSSTHQSSSERKSTKSRRCKARLFGYSSPSRSSLSAKQSALGDSLAKVRAHPRSKAKGQTIARSPTRENPYHEVRLQHNKVRPSTGVYECSSARQYPNENFRVRTTVSGTSRIRVTLSSDGSMLEIETEKLSNSADVVAAGDPDRRLEGHPDERGDSDDSDGYVRLSPQAAITGGSGSSQITHAQVERVDDGRNADCRGEPRNVGGQCYCGNNGSDARTRPGNKDKGWLESRDHGRLVHCGSGWEQDGRRKCAPSRDCDPGFADSGRYPERVNRMSRRNPNNISSSLSSSSSSSLSSSASPNRYDRRMSGRADRPADVAIVPCHDGGRGMLNQTRSRSRLHMQPTPVSSPMSPSFMDGFNYECALRGLCTDPTLVEADTGTEAPASRTVPESTLSGDRTRTSSGGRYLDASAKSESGQREGTRFGLQEASASGDGMPSVATDTKDVSTARRPPQTSDGDIDAGGAARQSASPPTDTTSDRCHSSPADDKRRGVETTELAQADDRGAMANGGCHLHLTDGTKPEAGCAGMVGRQAASSSHRNGGVAKRSDEPVPRNCANNAKKKRTKFWLRKVNSENDKDARSAGFGKRNGGRQDAANSAGPGAAERSSRKNGVRRLPGSKCLSFDSATMLERRVSRESPRGRMTRPTKAAFVHCPNGSAPRVPAAGLARTAEASRSLSYECCNSSEPGSSSSSNPNHANNTPRCSVQRSDSSGSAFSSDLSSSSRRSARKNRIIGENTKQQIVEVGLMVSNPLEHEVSYSIALDQDTADTLDAVDEGMELESATSDGRDPRSDIECRAAAIQRDGTPTEDIIVEEQTDRQINITPATTSINVHRDFFNSFEDLYDDEDVT